MKIVMISVMTPAVENIRGTSALPYHLMIQRDSSIEIILYTYNLNQLSQEQIEKVEQELNIRIHLLQVPRWYTWLFKLHLLFIRVFLCNPVGNYIRMNRKDVLRVKKEIPDGIWIYGEELSRVSRQFGEFKRVHTLPDCESLYYYRMMGNKFGINTSFYWRYALMYPKFINMEKNFDTNGNIHYHLVGEEDVRHLLLINPKAQAHFIRHPHYGRSFINMEKFSATKIRVLVAGQNNVYMANDAEEMIQSLSKKENVEKLSSDFEFTFLGKGWENSVLYLKNVGYEVHHIKFAEHYIEEICKYDIQITPISIGTGTKGKVLDALANGLMVIGSKYALENISAENGKSCMEYSQAHDVPQLLHKVSNDRNIYKEMAVNGQEAVLRLHDRKAVSKELFSLFA